MFYEGEKSFILLVIKFHKEKDKGLHIVKFCDSGKSKRKVYVVRSYVGVILSLIIPIRRRSKSCI